MWSLRNDYYHGDVFPFVFQKALASVANSKPLHENDVIPKELVPICRGISRKLTGQAFRSEALVRLPKYVSTERDEHGLKKDPRMLSYDEKQEAERFISHRLEPLFNLTKALAGLLAADARSVNNAFIELVKCWEDARHDRDPYETKKLDRLFSNLGLEAAVLALWARAGLKRISIERFLAAVHSQDAGPEMLVEIVSILAQKEGMEALAGEQSQKARALIQAEDDVSTRAALFARLGRALLPASISDASLYFREGLDQLDAIGSGDWDFANELLLFASAIRGRELDEHDFHRLTNICELNIPYEAEKFGWGMFARGLSKTAGVRGLAKLSRWDDRSKIRLTYTLLPYLTALVKDKKIEPDLALALNRLADPAEYWYEGTAEFAKAIEANGGTDNVEIIAELIGQFEDDNPTMSVESAVEVLASLAERYFGKSSGTTAYLCAAKKRITKTRGRTGTHITSDGGALPRIRLHPEKQDRHKRVRVLTANTNPNDPTSLAKAIKALTEFQDTGYSKAEFFASLRKKVAFHARSQYVKDISESEDLNLYSKITELKECRNEWGESSPGLDDTIKNTATRLVQLHADDLVGEGGRFARYQLKDISDLTRVPTPELVLELIKLCARPDLVVSGAVWLAFAAYVCEKADEGQGQLALEGLLRGPAAKLADSVTDAAWVNGLYPTPDVVMVAEGLVWRMLGSPYAEDRWRAAHSVRCFARFGRWNVVDALVRKLTETTAGPFQARELKFYYLHARLWLLIALARIALDQPVEIARYQHLLLPIALEANQPHILIRHFAARALLSCANLEDHRIRAEDLMRLRAVDLSPHPHVKVQDREIYGFNADRPSRSSKAKFEFHLDYDFKKLDVDSLSRTFGKPQSLVTDAMSNRVQQLDASVSSMYDTGGRRSGYRDTAYGISTRYHTYGQQLGWHALFFAAADLLKNFRVIDDRYHKDTWGEWLRGYLLTRDDGFWLSDATDRTPLDTVQTLLEHTKAGQEITGKPQKLLQLARLWPRSVKGELVIIGSWHSSDGVEVHISSALVAPGKARRLARELMREEPIRAWIPIFDDYEGDGEFTRGDKKDYTPWIVRPSGETRLDEHDPFGVSCANLRHRLSRDSAAQLSLKLIDRFGRSWQNGRGTIALRAEAWGREDRYSERGPHSGLRLFCSAPALRRILNKLDKNLVLLISLQRYEKEGNKAGGHFSHTVAAVRIAKTLLIEYFKGRTNYLQKPRS